MSGIDPSAPRIAFSKPERIRLLEGQSHLTLVRDDASFTDSVASSKRPTRDILDEKDSGCLITNVHRHTDQMVPMINAQHSDGESKSNIVRLEPNLEF